jgi:hypothetical protein
VLALGAIYLGICAFFGTVWLSGTRDAPVNLATAIVYLVIRLLGVGIATAKLRRSGLRRLDARGWMLLSFCAAFLLDAVGALLWLGYNLHGRLVPFPSLADLGYGGDTLLWAVGMLIFFWVLDTNVRDELGPFVDLLAVTWTLTVLMISLINGANWTNLLLPGVALSVFYPFVWALSSALAGALLFGPQQRRLQPRWRWFVTFVYSGSLITFLTNVAYSVTAASPPGSPAEKFLYYNGGPLDFLFATGDFVLLLAISVLPLHQEPLRFPRIPGDHPSLSLRTRATPASLKPQALRDDA